MKNKKENNIFAYIISLLIMIISFIVMMPFIKSYSKKLYKATLKSNLS